MPRSGGYQPFRWSSSGRSRAQLGAARADRPEPLVETGPRPRLDLLVPGLRLVPRRLEVFEPGVRLLDHQQLFRFALVHHWGRAPLRVGDDRDARTYVGRTAD